jgi:hypothetical protein
MVSESAPKRDDNLSWSMLSIVICGEREECGEAPKIMCQNIKEAETAGPCLDVRRPN